MRRLYAQCLQDSAETSPGPGDYEIFRYASGRISSATYVPEAGGEGWTDHFYYYASGRLEAWDRSYTGASQDVSEHFYYYASGRIEQWDRNFSGATTDQSFSVFYTTAGEVSDISSSGIGGIEVALCEP